MKVIFLDIDGVLNCQHYTNQIKTPNGFLDLDCVANLNKLVADTGAKIVLSSTWRHDADVIDNLKVHVQAEFLGKTPSLNSRYSLRGNEIHAWIQQNEALLGKAYHEYHSFVILDDDSDMLLWHADNYFRTDPWVGLTQGVAYRAARYLNRW
jgi:hypothetical protein